MALASSASARPEYPGYVQEAVGMQCVPSCTLCHTDPAGGADKLNTQYANFYGAALQHDSPTYDASVALAGDTDGDGKSDFDELKAGENPTQSGSAPVCNPIEYGCGVRAAPLQPESDFAPKAWLVGTLALAGIARLQLRRRSR